MIPLVLILILSKGISFFCVADGTDWRDWDSLERRIDFLVVRLILLLLLDEYPVHDKFDEYAEDFSANFMRDGMGPREGAGK